jgi:DNA-binding IclR family transcriptional regulator
MLPGVAHALPGKLPAAVGRHGGVARTDPNKSTTALRALRVLEVLGARRDPVAVAEVAASINADRSTAYRMLMTLVDAGYVDRDRTANRYQLSYKLVSICKHRLGGYDGNARQIMDCLHRLAHITSETVDYSFLDREETILIFKVEGTQRVAVHFAIGHRSPLHCTSIGKALLAFQDVRFVEHVIAGGLPAFTGRTITDPVRLRTELQRIRAQGYAYDDLEMSDDMRCVAVPVFERGGVVRGGISLSGPASRFTLAKLDELRDCLLPEARRLSLELGLDDTAVLVGG